MNDKIEKMLKRTQIPKIYWDARLSKIVPSKDAEKLTRFVNEIIEKGTLSSEGLYIYGAYGVGKSAAAAIILKSALSRGKFGLWTNFCDITSYHTDEKRYRYSEAESMYDRMLSSEILVIDEFSVTSKDWFPIQVIERAVRDRVRNQKPTIITSNHSPSSLSSDSSTESRKLRVLTSGLVSIFQEAVSGVCLTGKNWRKSTN
tara:strand:- start:13609 stop:14214 length:606 start_codon:yes stop_codon:yes gene_type:complete